MIITSSPPYPELEMDALLRLWPHMTLELQTRLLGAHNKHQKLSVKKIVATLRESSEAIAYTVAIIGQRSVDMPSKKDNSVPASTSAAVQVLVTKPHMECSPYVLFTCETLLEKYKREKERAAVSKRSERKISCEEFFLALVQSGSPMLLQWEEDGFNAVKIRKIFEASQKTQPQTMKTDLLPPHPHSLPVQTHQLMTPAASTTKDIFLSYGREESTTPFVTRLKADLEQEGYSVWVDTADIPSGSDWHTAIGQALQNCKALVALITRKYIKSKFCKNELFMYDSTHKPIFPVFLEEVNFDSHEEAGVLYVISSINWIMATGGLAAYDNALAKLLEGMKKKGVQPEESTCTPPDNTVDGFQKKPLKDYSVKEVCTFVEKLEIDPQSFRENSVSGEDLLELTDEDMKHELGLKTLQIRKLRKHIKNEQASD